MSDEDRRNGLLLENVRAGAIIVILGLAAFAVVTDRDVSLVTALLGAGAVYLGADLVTRRRNGK